MIHIINKPSEEEQFLHWHFHLYFPIAELFFCRSYSSWADHPKSVGSPQCYQLEQDKITHSKTFIEGMFMSV